MKKSYVRRQFLIFVFLLVFLIIGTVCLYVGLNTKKVVSLKYQEDNDIDYKVYLKDNDFFEEKYIDKGKTYITSLIDHIEVAFKYNIDFSEKVNAEYTYRVMAKIESNKSDNESEGNYWTKEFDITGDASNKIKNNSHYSIYQQVSINYNEYNELLNSFKKSVGLTNSSGLLSVYLIVDSKVDSSVISTPIKSDLVLKLPLSQLAIEATIDSDASNNIEEIKKSVKEDGVFYSALVILGAFCTVLSLFLVFVLIRSRRVYKRNYKYDLELEKILTTYDSIIVNVKDIPSIDGYDVIKVESFDELIDAHSEIRKPINYYHNEDYSVFLLLSDSIIWEYILRRKKRRRR